MYYHVFKFITFICCLFALSSCSQQDSDKDTLTIGLQSGYPPYEFMNDQGQIVGFDIDVGKAIAAKLNKTLVVKDMEFEGEILSLKQGKIDLIISGMNITPSRQKEIYMVPYHGEDSNTLSLIFWNSIPDNVKSIEDIAKIPGGSISVESGAIPETYMVRHHKNIQAKSFQGALAPLMDVKYGKSTANLVQQDVAAYLQKKHPEIRILNVPLAPEDAIQGFGIGINKNNTKLVAEVEKAISELKQEGVLEKLEQQWFYGGTE